MSNMYTLDTLLDAKFQSQTIQKILRQGSEIGCAYRKEGANGQVTAWYDYQEATAYIMNLGQEDKKKDTYCFPTIAVLFNHEVWFYLWFQEQSGLLAPYLWLNRTWYKQRNDQIDFEKYIRLFFLLTQGFRVVHMKTYDEAGDLDLYDEHEESRPQTRDCPELSLEPCFKVDVTLDATFTRETLSSLLSHGNIAGWKFLYQDKKVSIEEAIAAIFEQSPDGSEVASLTCSIDDMTYQISFTLRFNKFFMLTLRPLNTTLVPFRKTVEHALDLCTDFIIFELNTFDARYNYITTEVL